MTHSISRKKINTRDTESNQLIFWIWSSSTHKTSAKCTSQNYGFYELLWYNKYYIYMLICRLIKIVWLIISQNLSELQPFLGNWISGSRNAENGVSECSILKISWGSIPPDPPPAKEACTFCACKVPCATQKFCIRCFKKYVHYFKKPVENPDTNQLIYLAMN